MKKLFAFLVVVSLCACSKVPLEQKEQTVLTGKGEAIYENYGNQATVMAEITLEDGVIKSVSIDETYPDAEGNPSTKMTLKEEYGMRKASPIGKEWFEQIEYLQTKLVGTDGKIAVDEGGFATAADVISGCTINLTNIQAAIDDAIANAR